MENPPAFPCGETNNLGVTVKEPLFFGATLLDLFAGQALSGICSNPPALDASPDTVAELAFSLALAMLKARDSLEVRAQLLLLGKPP